MNSKFHTDNPVLRQLRGGLIVSCQAEGDLRLNQPEMLAAIAEAAVSGGAMGIRASIPKNIRAIREAVNVPVIGIYIKEYVDSEVTITPTLVEARALAHAGVDIIAMDATLRARPGGESLAEIVNTLREEGQVLLMADVATVAEAHYAAEMGFDLIGTTLAGYTAETRAHATVFPDFEVLDKIVAELGDRCGIIAQGRIATPAQAVEALRRGAYAVVTGTAVTRPWLITRNFTHRISSDRHIRQNLAVGIHLGGSKTSMGLVSGEGKTIHHKTIDPDWSKGTPTVLRNLSESLKQLIDRSEQPVAAVGIAATGRVNSKEGVVFKGSHLAKDFINYPVVQEVAATLHLPVILENDINAAAYGEYCFGGFRNARRLVCVTLGKGLGGGIVLDGKVYHGSGNAGEFGEFRQTLDGREDILENFVSRRRLALEIKEAFEKRKTPLPDVGQYDKDSLLALIRSGHPLVMEIFDRQMRYLASGIDLIHNSLDPDILVIGGSLSALGEILTTAIGKHLSYPINIQTSKQGNRAIILGVAQLALEKENVVTKVT